MADEEKNDEKDQEATPEASVAGSAESVEPSTEKKAEDTAAPAPEPVADAKPREAATASGLEDRETESAAAPAKKGRKSGRQVAAGIAHIKATFNNTSVSITDLRGGVIAWSNGGRAGFKGSRKSTAFAATLVGQDAARQAVSRGMHEVEVRVQGAGSGRESAIRALQSSGLNITVIKDVTPIPHNGCRPRKRRRV
jgi:small subunit ribosomal protein S11